MTPYSDTVPFLAQFSSLLSRKLALDATLGGEEVQPADLGNERMLFPVVMWHASMLRQFALGQAMAVDFLADDDSLLGYRVDPLSLSSHSLSERLLFLADAVADLSENAPRDAYGQAMLDAVVRQFIQSREKPSPTGIQEGPDRRAMT